MDFDQYLRSLPKAKVDKIPPEEFFKLITKSEEVAKKFIKELLAPVAEGRQTFDIRTLYHAAMAACTSANRLAITKNTACNFTAFSAALLHKFGISVVDIKALIEADEVAATEEPAFDEPDEEPEIPKLIKDNSMLEKRKRPTARAYFKEMTRSREAMIAFIQEYLAPAVAGIALHNVGSAYYSSIAKNSCETASSIMPNATCNYRAFKRKLETFSISPEELSNLLKIEVKYKPSKQIKNKPASTRELVLDILRNELDCYITDTDKLDLVVQSIYTELKYIMNRVK